MGTKKEKQTITDTQDLYLEEQANDLLEMAKQKGLNKNYVFNTTFNRYLTQIELLKLLKKDFANCDTTITKEYVKGRETITAHPLIAKINSTIDSANKTASLLVKMLIAKGLQVEQKELEPSEFFFMSDSDIIKALGSEEEKKAKLTKQEIKELADKLKSNYEEQYNEAHAFDL